MTLSVFVGATAPVERDTSPGEERPDWVDENTCEIEPLAGVPLPLAGATIAVHPSINLLSSRFAPSAGSITALSASTTRPGMGFSVVILFGVRVCLHSPLTWEPLAWASASRASVAGQKSKWDLLVVVV